jgi:hypothetical protein
VPPEKGRARFHDVRIWNIRATGATAAFEVDAYADVPLQRFSFAGLDIEAQKGGHIADARDWTFAETRLRLGAPVEIAPGSTVKGLAPDAFVVRAPAPRQDPSKTSFAEQDKN